MWETLITNSVNDAVISNYGELTIESGEYVNTATTYDGEYDYRRVIWTSEDSKIVINGGKFTNVAGNQCLCFNGTAIIENGEFAHNGNGSVIGNYNTTGELVINGGTFTNTATAYTGQYDYRRVIWTSEDSKIVINGGKFTNVAENQCLCLMGTAVIEDGEFAHNGNGSVIDIFNTTGEVVINGGTFSNTAITYAGQYDYRRAIWTSEDSKIVINGGKFTNVAGNQCLCFNGTAVIEDGEFTHNGNGSVIGNYNTTGEVVINGGTFSNTATTYAGQYDYRRAIWTSEGCNTIINGGNFKCTYSPWNLISYGSMTINNADIDTPNGTDCYIGGDCTVKYARMSGKYNIRGFGRTTVYAGLYSNQVPADLLALESNCIANSDISTKAKYPYVVTNLCSGIMDVEVENTINPEYYDVAGKRVMNPKRGSVVIIPDTKGRNVKKILK